MKILQTLSDKLKASAAVAATLIASIWMQDDLTLKGVFTMEHIRDGKVIYSESFPNTVVTVGKNALLDAALAGSSYTVTGPFVALISSVSYTGAPSASDTMTSHATWTEAGATNAPTYTSPRKTAAWSAASAGSKALSAAASFGILTSGTIKGAFMVYGSGAVSTIDSTAGTLFSAGLFTGGDRPVIGGDTVNVSYSVSV